MEAAALDAMQLLRSTAGTVVSPRGFDLVRFVVPVDTHTHPLQVVPQATRPPGLTRSID